MPIMIENFSQKNIECEKKLPVTGIFSELWAEQYGKLVHFLPNTLYMAPVYLNTLYMLRFPMKEGKELGLE